MDKDKPSKELGEANKRLLEIRKDLKGQPMTQQVKSRWSLLELATRISTRRK